MNLPGRVSAALAAALLCTVIVAKLSQAAEPRVALKGYDPVAYFTEHRPMKGVPAHRMDWDGARYQFASAKNRDLFSGDPDRYVPQFSGFCSAALSKGKKIEGDPNVWKIVDGRLYVFSRAGPAVEDPAVLARAHAKWKEMK